MKWEELVKGIDKIKNPQKKRDALVKVILVYKARLRELMEMYNQLDMSK